VKDGAKKEEIDPESIALFDYQNLKGLTAEFPLSEIARLRQSNPEFNVFVVGSDGSQKDFKVKKSISPDCPDLCPHGLVGSPCGRTRRG
jgi:hypothetical protein